MSNRDKTTMTILAVLALSVPVIAAGPTIPKDKETLTIDHLDGKKGAVTFAHEAHVDKGKTADGGKIVCKECHHTLAADEPAADETPKACSECHVQEGQPQKEHDGKKAPFLGTKKSSGKFDKKTVIFHKNCLDGCHKKVTVEGKKLKSCKSCHKSTKGEEGDKE